MKRLTQPGVDYCKEICKAECAYTVGEIDTRCVDAQIYRKLTAYEDTGLEPEDILTGLEMAYLFAELRKLDEVKKAEAEGRLLILPCKVGDTVSINTPSGATLQEVVDSILMPEFRTRTTGGLRGLDFQWRDFGKTVFLTRAEAEAAIRKENDT